MNRCGGEVEGEVRPCPGGGGGAAVRHGGAEGQRQRRLPLHRARILCPLLRHRIAQLTPVPNLAAVSVLKPKRRAGARGESGVHSRTLATSTLRHSDESTVAPLPSSSFL